MLTKTIVYIWNDENHSTWQDAKAHGVCDHVELDRIHPTTHLEHIKGMVNLFNRRTDKLSITLKFEVVELTSFSVGCQVLEWNEYSVECWATSKEDAVARVKDEGAVTFNKLDVSYGMSEYLPSENTADRYHSVNH